jgi:multiple sugar transport system permease protein
VIFVFLETWREFFLPLIYLNSQEKFTLAIGLNLLKGTADYNARYDLLMAVATVMALPPLLLFFFGQKYFVQGLAMTGLKG